MVSYVFFIYIRWYSACVGHITSTATILYQNSSTIDILVGFDVENQHVIFRCKYSDMQSHLVFLNAIRSRLIHKDTWLFDAFECFFIPYKHNVLHIWPNNIDYCGFSMISCDCTNWSFSCKIVLHHCLIWYIVSFPPSIFINTLSADIYD